jgi:hypothetical protein
METKEYRDFPFLSFILLLISFILFSMSDIFISFDRKTSLINHIKETNYKYIDLLKMNPRGTNISDSDIDALNKKTDFNFCPVFFSTSDSSSFSHFCATKSGEKESVFNAASQLNYSAVIQGSKLDFRIIGKYPSQNDEVAISSFNFLAFKNLGFHDASGWSLEPDFSLDETEFLEKEPVISFDNFKLGLNFYSSDIDLKITAIIDTGFEESFYDPMLTSIELPSSIGYQYLISDADYGFILALFVSDSFKDGKSEGALNKDTPVYSSAIAKMPKERSDLEKLTDLIYPGNDDSYFSPLGILLGRIGINLYRNYFIIAGCLFLLFGVVSLLGHDSKYYQDVFISDDFSISKVNIFKKAVLFSLFIGFASFALSVGFTQLLCLFFNRRFITPVYFYTWRQAGMFFFLSSAIFSSIQIICYLFQKRKLK